MTRPSDIIPLQQGGEHKPDLLPRRIQYPGLQAQCLQLCTDVALDCHARGTEGAADGALESGLMHLAARSLQDTHPTEAERLMQAVNAWVRRGGIVAGPADLLQAGWLSTLPDFRGKLLQLLEQQGR